MFTTSRFSRRLKVSSVIAGACLLSLVASACGAGPNSTDASGSTSFEEAATKTSDQLADIYDQLDGLGESERKAELIELAKEEDGPIVWYTAAADDDTAPLIKKFKEETGIDVQVYRASSATVLAKTMEEAKAGRIRGDVLNFSGLDPTIASNESLYADLETPLADQMVEGTVHDDWIADQLYPFIVAWNTERYQGKSPETFKDVLTAFGDGELAFEATDSNWLFGVVQLLQEQEGVSEQEAIDMVADAARRGVPVVGHTLLSELLASGQYVAAATTYHYRSARQVEDGAPVAWEPQPGPVITTVSGTGIAATTSRPASALLFVEFQLTGEQEYWVEAGRTPTNENYQGGILGQGFDLYILDDDALYAELQKWDDLYAEMMQSSGRPVRE
ncbi:extracellular solute-binding protein [Nocardioides sp. LMS-CY]|uniref:ABC-type Fe3+ transport system substrate-binding protein n=1 Tax=Nocardioides soli TaxID=1036020 RepID=A0A7W4VWG7_9ACTN|nr:MULTISPECIES: extracellular solute-binding protein [Nocardioides]MBB3042597.1 ABC-type Fe3+ transport system substrate-binding protein [Nocardioides soli]QWF22721.1 extracellular solute-binding protein [Nocardioides sp. LMS-CY]